MIKPLGTNVIIEPVEEKLSDTIVVPDGVREASNVGMVVAIGPQVVDVAVGDKVFFGRYEGKKIRRDERDLRIVPMVAIMGVFETVPAS